MPRWRQGHSKVTQLRRGGGRPSSPGPGRGSACVGSLGEVLPVCHPGQGHPQRALVLLQGLEPGMASLGLHAQAPAAPSTVASALP